MDSIIEWPYEYKIYLWPLLISILILIIVGFYAIRKRNVPGAVSFIFLVAVILLWVTANALGLAATVDKTRVFWFKFERALLLPAVVAEFCFVFEYAGLGNWVTRRTVSVLAVMPFLFALLILTNDTHHLVWTRIWLDGNVHIERGPASWAAVFYAYFLTILQMMVLTWLFARSPRHRWLTVWLILAPVMVRAAFFLDFIHWNPIAPLNYMVVVMNFALLPYALAVFHFHMFDVVPMVRDTVMEKMADGIIVLDANNRVSDINEAAQKIFGFVRSKVVGREATEILRGYPELLRLAHGSGETQCEALFENTCATWYQSSISPLIDRRGFLLGHLLLLHDISEQKRIQAKLLDHQQTLAMLREREILGRELHDGIGQMLAAAQLQVKVAYELLQRGDTASVESCLNHLADLTQKAKESVRDYLIGVKAQSYPELSIVSMLRQYLNHYSHHHGIHAELVAPAEFEEIALDATIKAQLQPIIREALTNVRRHSRASSVRIVFALNDSEVLVTVEDDGRGFDSAEMNETSGFGLRSMQGRADMLGAFLEVKSSPGMGTQIIIRVPWERKRHENSISG